MPGSGDHEQEHEGSAELGAEGEALPEADFTLPEDTSDPLAGELPEGAELPADFGAFGEALPGGAEEGSFPPPEGFLPDAEALVSEEEPFVLPDPGLAEGAFPESPLLAPPAADLPTFQMSFPSLTPAQKAKLRDLAEAQGIALTPSAWSAGTPVLTQLTEYQAVALRREARAQGIEAEARVSFPLVAPSEEDLALGDLAAVPEPTPVLSEGAPSVALPAREREVLLFTGDELPGFRLLETRGPVTAHRSIARRLFREEEARAKMQREIDRVAGKGAATADSHLQLLFRALFLDLQKQALSLGANAVLSLRVETFPETEGLDAGNRDLRLLVIGTAAVVDKS